MEDRAVETLAAFLGLVSLRFLSGPFPFHGFQKKVSFFIWFCFVFSYIAFALFLATKNLSEGYMYAQYQTSTVLYCTLYSTVHNTHAKNKPKFRPVFLVYCTFWHACQNMPKYEPIHVRVQSKIFFD